LIVSLPNFKQMKITCFKSLILIATFLIFTNCKDSTPETYKLPQNAIELICGKEEKVWKLAKRLNNNIRMNMVIVFYPTGNIFEII